MTTALAAVALVVAVAALVLAAVVMRQNATTVDELRAHRRAHARAAGSPDPDRRTRDTGPPDGIERRTPDRARPARMITVDEPLTPERADQIRQEVATAHLERQDAPTTQIAAQRPRPENPQ